MNKLSVLGPKAEILVTKQQNENHKPTKIKPHATKRCSAPQKTVAGVIEALCAVP